MDTNLQLPDWLDKFIYDELKAPFSRKNNSFVVINMDKREVLEYLGTYFPRSFAEAYGIFQNLVKMEAIDLDKESLDIFDLCCGSAGEIIGILEILRKNSKKIKKVNLILCDGNPNQIELARKVLERAQDKYEFKINYQCLNLKIASKVDLELLNKALNLKKLKFDIMLNFKTGCEFLETNVFKGANPYRIFTNFFLKNLKDEGICIVEDVTVKHRSMGWLGCMIERLGYEFVDKVIDGNEEYNKSFTVKHSYCYTDLSKVAWRTFKKCG